MTDERLILAASEYVAALLLYINSTDPEAKKPEKPEELSWETVYLFSKSQSLASGIFSAVESDVRREAPGTLTAAWDKERATDLAKHIKQSSEFKRLTIAFAEEKINFLPLKGFIYKALWKNPANRTMSDMDIYFHPTDMPRVEELLLSMGYERSHACDADVSYIKKPFLNVEAHRKFVENGPSYEFDIWQKKSDNPYWHIMNHEQFLTFNALHAYKHYENGGCGMRLVFDLFLYEKHYAGEIDQKRLECALKEEQVFDFYRLMQSIGKYWFDGGEKNEELAKVALYIATGGTYGTHSNSIRHGIEKRGKFGYVLARVFPPYKRMRIRYPILRKLPILLPLMYVVRFVDSIFSGRSAKELKEIKHHDSKKQ